MLNACCTHTSSLMELMEARIYGASSVVTWLYRQSFLPDDIENWLSFTVLLAGILSNVYLGLYVSEKNSKTLSGMRVLVGNQVFANLLGIFSHAFFPTYNVRSQDDGTRMNHLCKIMPSLGFLGVAVSLSNLACICVSYYLMKSGNRSVCLSRRVACCCEYPMVRCRTTHDPFSRVSAKRRDDGEQNKRPYLCNRLAGRAIPRIVPEQCSHI